jgi:hypothetical protein
VAVNAPFVWHQVRSIAARRTSPRSRQRQSLAITEALESRQLLSGVGLSAVYFATPTFSGSLVRRVDPVINFDWDGRSPAKGISGTDFSARWTGQFRAPVTGAYTFYIDPAGAASVWINGRLLINGPTSSTGAIKLRAAHRYDLQVDYLQTGGAPARLLWSAPGISQQVVPTTYLFPSALPQAPTSLTAQPLSTSRIQLAWVDRSGKEMGFKVFRASNGGALQRIATLAPNTTSFTDSGMIESTDYTYQVIAYNDSGSSAPAGPTTATTNAAAAPAPASDVKTSVFSAARIDLSWADNAANETGYVVERSLDGNTYQPRATLAANATAYTDAGLQPDTHYYYRVKAENGAGFTLSATADAKTKLNATVDGNGWTTIVPSSDSRIIYVSSSTGSDTNSGLFENAPVKTLAKGYSLLRNGMPDQMLLKKGDVFGGYLGGQYGTWEKAGRSMREPLLVGAYGTGANRPLIKTGVGQGIAASGVVGNVAVIGIDFYSDGRDPQSQTFSNPASNPTGLRWLGGDNLIVEDCAFRYFGTDITIQNYSGAVSNVTLRRNIIVDAYSTVAHSQGLYMDGVEGALIQGNLFDHNGYNEIVAGASPTMFNHDAYLNTKNTGLVVIENIFSRASSHGLQARPGGYIADNLFFSNPISLLVGSAYEVPGGAKGSVINNVIMAGDDIDATNPRGTGINVTNVGLSGLLVEGNIIAQDASAQPYGYAIAMSAVNDGLQNVTVQKNIIYKWRGGISVTYGSGTLSNLDIRANSITELSGRLVTVGIGVDLSQLSFSSNNYSGSASSKWFVKAGASDYSLNEWKQVAPEADAADAVDNYTDSNRSIGSYNATLDGDGSPEAFLAKARLQSRETWDQNYTAVAANAYVRDGFAVGKAIAPGS